MAKTKEVVKPFKRTVDPKGLDKGQATEIESLVKHNDTFKGFEPTAPRFGNPVKQVADFVRGLSKKPNSTGNGATPSTIHDKGTTQSPAELEKIARKYVDR